MHFSFSFVCLLKCQVSSIRFTVCIFFFQAEDGIRDLTVTGVQTCALPIGRGRRGHHLSALRLETAPAERAVPGGGTLGRAGGEGSGRAQGGSAREAGGAGPGAGRRRGAGASRRAVVPRAAPRGPARRRGSQSRPRVSPR